MRGIRDWFQTGGGRVVAVALAGLALFVLWQVWRSNFSTSDAGRASADRIFICSETGKSFRHTLREGERIPVKSPHSKKLTGYEADLCYWTREGGTKAEPTCVYVVRRWGGSGPTFCPDCGRLVRPLNPAPVDGTKPPPTKAEYKAGRDDQTAEER